MKIFNYKNLTKTFKSLSFYLVLTLAVPFVFIIGLLLGNTVEALAVICVSLLLLLLLAYVILLVVFIIGHSIEYFKGGK